MPLDPKAPIYPPGARARKIVRRAAYFSIACVLGTVVVVGYAWAGGTYGLPILYGTIGLWAIGPPIWFWREYFYLYRAEGEPDTLELFKYGQDVSKAIWAGVLAALIAFAASDAAKPPSSKCTLECPGALSPPPPRR